MTKDITTLRAVYKEKQEKYEELVDAFAFAIEAADRISRLVQEQQTEMFATGEELLRAMGRLSE